MPRQPSTPPPRPEFPIPGGGANINSPSTSRPPRNSISSSFSFGPQSLVNSYIDANSSTASIPVHSYALDPNRSVLPSTPVRSSPQVKKRIKDNTGGQHPLATDRSDVFGIEDEDADNFEWNTVDRMRLWRHDAMMQHLYETAAFWGDKILSWTNDPNDAFWLAQTQFLMTQYSRAERLLTRPFATTPLQQSSIHQPPAANGHHPVSAYPSMFPGVNAKGKEKELDPMVEGLGQRRLPMGPGGLIDIPVEQQENVSRLVDMSVACRYLAAQCQVRQGKWADATEMLGEANPFRNSARSGPAIPNVDGGIKVEASMCHLRGLLMLKLNRMDQAKLCFMEALALDVKCYEAFEQLISGEMMTTDEEWEFVQGLAYKEQTPEDAEFVQLIYTARLRKYKHATEHRLTRKRLAEEFALSDNPDVLFSFADALYAQHRWGDCFALTTRILSLVSMHSPTMPLHIACMYHLKHLRAKLFMLAHEMVEKEPEAPMSWYAVGVWYLAAGKWADARTYFSKTTLMDPRFSPAWVAFAHTFAKEGEHDHAVTAYSTCARLFTGSHLPLLFVGMEHIQLSNTVFADEALEASQKMCDEDPLLFNERGIMAFEHGDYERAEALFSDALALTVATQNAREIWVPTMINLGTARRNLGKFPEAKAAYEDALQINPRHAIALAFLGITEQLGGDTNAAIARFHESLSVDSMNGYVTELLNIALESFSFEMLSLPPPGGKEHWQRVMLQKQTKEPTSNPTAASGRLYNSRPPASVDIDMEGG